MRDAQAHCRLAQCALGKTLRDAASSLALGAGVQSSAQVKASGLAFQSMCPLSNAGLKAHSSERNSSMQAYYTRTMHTTYMLNFRCI